MDNYSGAHALVHILARAEIQMRSHEVFFSPFDRAEISSLVCETALEISAQSNGLKLSSRNRKPLFCSGSRAEISARLTGLKFAIGNVIGP